VINYALRQLTPWRKNTKVHHRIHNSSPPVPILRQSNPIHTLPANHLKIHSDPIPPTPWSSEWSLSFGLFHQNLVHFTFPSHACHMPCLPHSPWLDLISGIWGEYKLWSSSLCNFLHSPVTSPLLGPNILLRTLFSNTLSLCSSLSVRDQVSHLYKTTGRIMVLYILTFTFLYSQLRSFNVKRTDTRLNTSAWYVRCIS
jgi:hypothetical protein